MKFISTRIIGLRKAIRPAHIAWLIVAIVINAIQGIAFFAMIRKLHNVGAKFQEAIKPRLVHLDTTPAIIFVTDAVYSVASSLNLQPKLIFFGGCHSVGFARGRGLLYSIRVADYITDRLAFGISHLDVVVFRDCCLLTAPTHTQATWIWRLKIVVFAATMPLNKAYMLTFDCTTAFVRSFGEWGWLTAAAHTNTRRIRSDSRRGFFAMSANETLGLTFYPSKRLAGYCGYGRGFAATAFAKFGELKFELGKLWGMIIHVISSMKATGRPGAFVAPPGIFIRFTPSIIYQIRVFS